MISNRKGKTAPKPIIQYNLDGKLINEWPSTMEIEKKLCFTNSNISKCCNGKYKTAYGFRWVYK